MNRVFIAENASTKQSMLFWKFSDAERWLWESLGKPRIDKEFETGDPYDDLGWIDYITDDKVIGRVTARSVR